ncbi:HesA/MoeB/ThiF family protein [Marivita hallyeonensis]|uniref:Molybdopterin-synthase adenylyltransferase n=1 Tax=Marivita hallyeonensis TaxID=996342 RepID=A0A1M5M2L8_9RHOB|nr:molybdopterin-synthase adenylyltransferase MoeB [Marivita hallyeonensis]SHG71537.1 Molybdopterin or thiamine biosynthesis adenylyltransferase [Marivita hallyeonensis]
MIVVFAMAGALWGLGAMMRMPRSARLYMIGLLYVGVLIVQIALPMGHPLREATGGSAALWLLIGVFAAIAVVYGRVIRGLRGRAVAKETEETPPVQRPASFSNAELERYARHIVLREIGGVGQKALRDAKVLVIGAGGLGAPALQYLAAAGVGTIGVIDDDVVENANLQRQVIHRDDAIGMPKVFSAQASIVAQNPYVDVRPYHRRLTEEIAADLFADYDLVLDGTDNFDTRFLANRVAVALGKPLISGALSQWEGQISVFDPAEGAPCYQCIFPEAPAEGLAPSCAEAGVIGPLPGVIGSMMAVEAIKLITGAGQALRGEMLIYDALWGETRKILLKRREDCPVCGSAASA